MLVATIEVWPFGHETEKRQVSRLFIGNTLVREGDECVYRCTLRTDNEVPIKFTDDDPTFLHRREDGAEACVAKALEALEVK